MSVLDAIAGRFGRLTGVGRSVVRYGFRLDTNPVPGEWRHVTKVDPEERKKLPIAYPRYLTHTDAISVGGSADVTDENTARTFEMLKPLATPAFHEPSGADHVTRETLSAATFLAVPQVLNGDDEAFVGTLGAGVESVRERMMPEIVGGLSEIPIVGDRLPSILTDVLLADAVIEAYIVQNPDSAAARESGVTAADTLSARAAKQRAMAAEYVLDAEILYLEYSGTYGGSEAHEALAAIADGVEWTRVWYGGGVDSREKALDVLDAGADAVVVGDVFHRVAEEEARLASAYLADLDFDDSFGGAAPGGAAAWLRDNCSIEETAAARFLSTIPSVGDPIGEARRCLAAGLRARRAIVTGLRENDAVGGGVDAETVDIVRGAVCVDVDDGDTLAVDLIEAVRGDDAGFSSEKVADLDGFRPQ